MLYDRDYERIVLTKAEKKIIAQVRNHPGITLGAEQFGSLYRMGLIDCKTDGIAPSGQRIRTNQWVLTREGERYLTFKQEQRRDTFLKSVFCPIVVSLITNMLIWGIPVLIHLLTTPG